MLNLYWSITVYFFTETLRTLYAITFKTVIVNLVDTSAAKLVYSLQSLTHCIKHWRFQVCCCRLLSVSLDSATRDRNTGQSRAVEVELCNCPPGYRGPSCEECEAGYTRIEDGLFLGVCEPCNCNGFSSECDPDTGHCMVSSPSWFK